MKEIGINLILIFSLFIGLLIWTKITMWLSDEYFYEYDSAPQIIFLSPLLIVGIVMLFL